MKFWMMFGLWCFAVAPAFSEMALSVMSFNVRYGTAKDGENDWEHRRDFLVEAIRASRPDVLGTQECLDFQAEYIVQQIPEYRWIGIGRDADGTGEMTAIFYKKDDLVPLALGHFWLSEQPEVPGSKSWDSSLPRIASWVRFYHPKSKTQFYHVNTHLDHRGEEARAQGAALIAKKAAQWTAEAPVVLTGDFNAGGGESRPWNVLTQAGLKDTRIEAKDVKGPQGTFCNFEKLDPAGARIDWILVSSAWKPSSNETVSFQKNGRFPSDHLPVLAHLSLEQ